MNIFLSRNSGRYWSAGIISLDLSNLVNVTRFGLFPLGTVSRAFVMASLVFTSAIAAGFCLLYSRVMISPHLTQLCYNLGNYEKIADSENIVLDHDILVISKGSFCIIEVGWVMHVCTNSFVVIGGDQEDGKGFVSEL